MSLERLWNGWRSQYVRGFNEGTRNEPGRSVFTAILQSGSSDEETHIVHRGPTCFAILNAFPYSTGHMLVLPYREVADLEDLDAVESVELWSTVTDAVAAVKRSTIRTRSTWASISVRRPVAASHSTSTSMSCRDGKATLTS